MINFNKDFDMSSDESSARIMPIFAEIKGDIDSDEAIQSLDGQDIPILALRNMVLFPEKRFGKRVCIGYQRRDCPLQTRKKGKIFMEESTTLRNDSAGALAEHGA